MGRSFRWLDNREIKRIVLRDPQAVDWPWQGISEPVDRRPELPFPVFVKPINEAARSHRAFFVCCCGEHIPCGRIHQHLPSNAHWAKMFGKGKSYVSTYCNFPHLLRNGAPVDHECRILPPEGLRAEMWGDNLTAAKLYFPIKRG